MPQYLVHADPQFLVVKDDRASKKPLGYDAQIHKEMIRIVMERHYDLGQRAPERGTSNPAFSNMISDEDGGAFAGSKSTSEVTG